MQLLRLPIRLFAFLTLALLFCSSGLHAQVTGAITGRVTDSSGAVVAGAKITATNNNTNFTQDTTTDSGGEYHLPALPPGTYTLKMVATGFETFTTTAIDVKVNDQLRI